MNTNKIGNIKINPYNFDVYDEGILYKAVYNNMVVYARSIEELEENVINKIEEEKNKKHEDIDEYLEMLKNI